MTVAELRKALEEFPDDMEVFVYEFEGQCLAADPMEPITVRKVEVGTEPGTVRTTPTHPNYGEMANVREAVIIA